jgi:hypothetical protein
MLMAGPVICAETGTVTNIKAKPIRVLIVSALPRWTVSNNPSPKITRTEIGCDRRGTLCPNPAIPKLSIIPVKTVAPQCRLLPPAFSKQLFR